LITDPTRTEPAAYGSQRVRWSLPSFLVGAGLVGAWVFMVGKVLSHRLFISSDSLSNTAHVWWIADRLWHGHGIPFHMPVIGHGQGLTYPYAAIPWTLGALLWPIMGEHGVTVLLVVGWVAVVAAMLWALPELTHNGWLFAGAVGSPVLVAAGLVGQLPFAWASALLFLAVGLWRRQRVGAATVAAGLAQITHPAVVLPMALVFVAIAYARTRDRRLLRAYGLSVLMTLPAIAVVVITPVFKDTAMAERLFQLVTTVGVRILLFVVPAVLVWIGASARRVRWAPVLALLILLSNLYYFSSRDNRFGYRGLWKEPNTKTLEFVRSAEFVPGATYRVLRTGDGKISMYQVLTHGGRLDSEFFPESIARRSFTDEREYASFLRVRRVDAVLVYANYDNGFHTNEHRLLDGLTARAGCGPDGLRVERFHHEDIWDGYRVSRSCAP
jgi:hypothetical protein